MAETAVKEGRFEPEIIELEGKTAIVTGGTTGIGRATANLLSCKGVKVVITGRHEEEMQDALHDLEETGGQFHGIIADHAYEDQTQRVFAEARDRFGTLDILVNNAALPGQSIVDSDYEEALYIIRTNLLGYLTCIREAIQQMRQNGGGHIVNIGSMSAEVREAESDIYVATKAGIRAMSESLRKVHGQDGIRISLIEPGSVGTNLQGEPPDVEKQVQLQAEQKQLEAEDIAGAVYFVLTQPPRSNVLQMAIAPTKQGI